jgi:conjugative element/phage-associated large polyvalent protein
MRPESQSANFATIRRRFEFRSIEIGRWVSEPEKDRAAVRFQQALNDLMDVLGGPEHLISLRQTLGLQYGIGGRPGVSAHYLPTTRQLALAKNAGAGSLAHEWFHAFDHYMGSRMFQKSSKGVFASTGWLESTPLKPHPLNGLLAECFKAVMLNQNGTEPSELFRQSRRSDQSMGVLYYARPEEMCARAFEAFVEDARPMSHFLVRGSRQSDEARAGLYPQGEQRSIINEAFRRYFQALGGALYRELADATMSS